MAVNHEPELRGQQLEEVKKKLELQEIAWTVRSACAVEVSNMIVVGVRVVLGLDLVAWMRRVFALEHRVKPVLRPVTGLEVMFELLETSLLPLLEHGKPLLAIARKCSLHLVRRGHGWLVVEETVKMPLVQKGVQPLSALEGIAMFVLARGVTRLLVCVETELMHPLAAHVKVMLAVGGAVLSAVVKETQLLALDETMKLQLCLEKVKSQNFWEVEGRMKPKLCHQKPMLTIARG